MVKNIIKEYLVNIIESIDDPFPKKVINYTIHSANKRHTQFICYEFYFQTVNINKEYDLKMNDLFFKKYNQKLYNDVKNPYKTYPFTPTKNGKEISFIENQNYRFSIELDPILMIQRIREEKLNSIGL